MLWEICRHDGHVGGICVRILGMLRVELKLRACRKSVFEAFIVGDVLTALFLGGGRAYYYEFPDVCSESKHSRLPSLSHFAHLLLSINAF